MITNLVDILQSAIKKLHDEGLYKPERIIDSKQEAVILSNHREVINLCANNYLGLANHPEIIKIAHTSLDKYGYGMASVRFICGTQTCHKTLERNISDFLCMEDTILYSSCFDANGGLFETLLDAEDAIISDALNHASIIDGIRLCKASKYRYDNNDMNDLEKQLRAASNARLRLIVTDGVFSMDGIIANLQEICALAEKYDAIVMVDDSHAVGVLGEHGRGTHEHCSVIGKIDIITGTLGKALGGASGGYIAANAVVVDWLRQRSRPYLFSNTLSPMIAATSSAVIDYFNDHHDHLLSKLRHSTQYFRQGLSDLGFTLIAGEHPIIPVMLGDAKLAMQVAQLLLNEGIYVIGFSYPVVPIGKARIRIQISAAHETTQLDCAIAAFAKIGKNLNII